MRYDPKAPQNPDNDRFVLSKGHAAPILYAAWAEAGLFPREELLKLRRIDTDLEGHPTPRLSFVDVATGSLGQGICAAVGIALNARRIKSDYRTYVLLGDGEMAEGSVWEAGNLALHYKLDNLCGIIDVNGLGQSQATQFDHDMDRSLPAGRRSAGTRSSWTATTSRRCWPRSRKRGPTSGRPTMVLARTLKGKGLSAIEGKDGWHGKALKKGKETDDAIAELEKQFVPMRRGRSFSGHRSATGRLRESTMRSCRSPHTSSAISVATREAWGAALAAVGSVDERIVALDADVKNSTFSDKFEKAHPDRFFEDFIAEQVMVGAAMGLGGARRRPVPVDVRLLPDTRGRFHPHVRHLIRQRQARRIARRRSRLARTGRPRWRSRICR